MLFLFSPSSVCRRLIGRAETRSPNCRSRYSSGFTLLELLTVIALVATLAGLVVGVGRRASESGYTARAKAELAGLSVALENYQRLCGDYPQTNDGAQLLQSLIGRRGPHNEVLTTRRLIETDRFTTQGVLDPSVNSSAVLIDPWGQPYRYAYKSQSPWNNFSYVLYSAGPDRRDSPTLLIGGLLDPIPPENADNLAATHD